ncbi:MAG: SAM-dependent chlorinase/fluorinase [Acidobacteria bacterium]|nr:SAM-dependent chlorinase/fluorinase [Acidobacteriota bacterium]
MREGSGVARGIVTLTTDFGTGDPFVGTMKGVILGINPEVELVDISHDIRAFDVMEAAYVVAQAYRYFPPRTIHLVVVDPGVGTARRPLLASADRYLFVAPDNGVLSVIYAKEESLYVRHITASHYFLEPVSNTFHGRDIFAPIAGWLSRHVETDKFGELITDYTKFALPVPKRVNEKLVKALVLRVDRFGTLMTNLTPADLPELFQEKPAAFKIMVGKGEVTQLKTAYADGAQGELFAILGSSGYIEIAANRGSASQALGVGRGVEVGVVIS